MFGFNLRDLFTPSEGVIFDSQITTPQPQIDPTSTQPTDDKTQEAVQDKINKDLKSSSHQIEGSNEPVGDPAIINQIANRRLSQQLEEPLQEQPPADQPNIEQPPADQPNVNQPPDQLILEQPHIEQQLVEQPQVQQQPPLEQPLALERMRRIPSSDNPRKPPQQILKDEITRLTNFGGTNIKLTNSVDEALRNQISLGQKPEFPYETYINQSTNKMDYIFEVSFTLKGKDVDGNDIEVIMDRRFYVSASDEKEALVALHGALKAVKTAAFSDDQDPNTEPKLNATRFEVSFNRNNAGEVVGLNSVTGNGFSLFTNKGTIFEKTNDGPMQKVNVQDEIKGVRMTKQQRLLHDVTLKNENLANSLENPGNFVNPRLQQLDTNYAQAKSIREKLEAKEDFISWMKMDDRTQKEASLLHEAKDKTPSEFKAMLNGVPRNFANVLKEEYFKINKEKLKLSITNEKLDISDLEEILELNLTAALTDEQNQLVEKWVEIFANDNINFTNENILKLIKEKKQRLERNQGNLITIKRGIESYNGSKAKYDAEVNEFFELKGQLSMLYNDSKAILDQLNQAGNILKDRPGDLAAALKSKLDERAPKLNERLEKQHAFIMQLSRAPVVVNLVGGLG